MSHLTKSELESVFLDVRKAYRLLYYYQRRVLDTVKFIADTLARNVASGYSLFSNNAPRNGARINMDCWAWDWLNMFHYEFFFTEEERNGSTILFAVAVQSDTGYYDAQDPINRTNVEQFASPELSQTRLLIYAGKNTWKPGDFDSFYKSNGKTEYEKKQLDENKVFLAMSFPLSDFIDEANILAHLQKFFTYCSRNGIPELTAANLQPAIVK